MTNEEYRNNALVHRALTALRNEKPAWGKNLDIFEGMTGPKRLHWYAQAQKQAALGVPAMQELVNAVILLRLTS